MLIKPPPHDLPAKIVAFITGLSLLGGLSHFFDRATKGKLNAHWIIELAADILYSLSAGFTVWYAAEGANLCPYTAAALAIVGGHLGAKLMVVAQSAIIRRTTILLTGTSNNTDDKEKP